MSIEAMKQALEWAENSGEIVFAGGGDKAVEGMNAWAAALRTAIEQAEKQEPVAWIGVGGTIWKKYSRPAKAANAQPLYTAPPAAKRQPLTRQQIEELFEDGLGFESPTTIVRAIEAAHGITGEKA